MPGRYGPWATALAVIPQVSSRRKRNAVTAPIQILAIDGSPTGGGRTLTAVRAVLAAAEAAGARISERSLAHDAPMAGPDELVAEMDSADGLVVGSPIYRASYAAPLKTLLDVIPRGMWGEKDAPLR